jgi:hypothetical protein
MNVISGIIVKAYMNGQMTRKSVPEHASLNGRADIARIMDAEQQIPTQK